jgi:hypothetical protein
MYSLVVEMKGFKRTLISGIVLTVTQQARVDAQLQVGSVTTQVQVSGAAPLVETTTSSLGTVVTSQESVELPLNLRRYGSLATLVPGTQIDNGGAASSTGLGSPFSETTYNANGGRDSSNNYLIDGIMSRNLYWGGFEVQPPPEDIEEFKIQTNIYSAAFGLTSASTINLITKSGTNAFHGTAYEFLRNDDLDGRNFFATNQTNPLTGEEIPGSARPEYRRNQFGLAGGGPIQKDKTFIFGYYDALRQREGNSITSEVPTDAQKAGDFSSLLTGQTANLCGSGGPSNLNFDTGQLFNPGTEQLFTCPSGALAGSSILAGTPINGNVITSLDHVAQEILPFFPEANRPGYPNFVNQIPSHRTDDQFGVRMDHNFGTNDRVYGRYLFGQSSELNPGESFSPLPGFAGTLYFRGQNVGLHWTHDFGPSLINDAVVGFSRDTSVTDCQGCPRKAGLLEGLGIQHLHALSPSLEEYPSFGFANFAGVGDGSYVPAIGPHMYEVYGDNLTWSHGRHTVVVGGSDTQWQILGLFAPFSAGGRFYYDGRFSSLGGEIPGVSGVSDLADFLTGYPQYAAVSDTNNSAYLVGGALWNFYGQDDFRVTPNLTLNFGLRWEYQRPYLSKQDKLVIFQPLGPEFSGPGNAGLITALPDAQNDALCTNPFYSYFLTSDGRCLIISSAQRRQLGFTGRAREALLFPTKRDYAPRFGLNWRPTHSDKLVLRGGAGIFYDFPSANSTTMSQYTPLTVANLIYTTAVGAPPPLTNGVPTTVENVLGSGVIPPLSQQYAQFGQAYYEYPRVSEWSFGIESQLAQNWGVKVDYVGNSAHHLDNERLDFNQPYPGVGALQPRRPYPDFNSNLTETSDDNSNFNSLQAQLTKRFASGFTLLTSYTYSKTLDDGTGGQSGGIGATGQQIDSDRSADHGRSYMDARQRLVFSYIWEMPVGKGKRFLGHGRVVGSIVGGWELSGIFSLQSGFPISIESPVDYSNTGSPNPRPDRICSGVGNHTVESWFNTNCFTTQFLEQALAAGDPRFGDSGRDILDGPGIVDWDFGLMKNFQIRERFKLQFRSEFYNLMNHPNFGAPNVEIGTPFAGEIGSAGAPREIQFGLKLAF